MKRTGAMLVGLCLALLLGAPAAQAMKFFKRDGVLILYGTYASGDEARLDEALTPEVRTVILRSPNGGGLARGRELARRIERAGVTTVVHGPCTGMICPMLFLAGRERLFSGETRPEASYLRLTIASGYLPDTAGEDRGESWASQMDWWRSHTRLTREQTQPLHAADTANLTPPAESKLFFHPAAQTLRGSVMHCWGERQAVPDCTALADTDALQLGIITRSERYRDVRVLRERPDLPRPRATAFAALAAAPGQLVSEGCNKLYARFLDYDAPRAFVISASGGCFARSAQSLRPYAEALAACTKASPGRECRFYAVDDEVVFTDFSEPLPESSPAS